MWARRPHTDGARPGAVESGDAVAKAHERGGRVYHSSDRYTYHQIGSTMSPSTSPRRAHHLAAVVLAAACAVALSACDKNMAHPAKGPSPAASSEAGSRSASGGDGGGSTGGAQSGTGGGRPTVAQSAASAAGSAGRCRAASMRMSLGRPGQGAGNIRYALVFTNSGKQPCTLRGYPGVSLLARDGQSIGRPAGREGGAGQAVTLAPGASAHAVLHTVNEGRKGSGCWKGADLVQAYPPGSTESMTTRGSGLRVCGNAFTVSTLSPAAG